MTEKFIALRATDRDQEIVKRIQAQYSQPWNQVTRSQALRIALEQWDTNRQSDEDETRKHDAASDAAWIKEFKNE
jgi:hypothetical protein